jgi:flagellar basal body-associated protein FliL
MKKYFFNFETESKQIGFYNNLLLPDDSDEEIDKEKNKYKISFWILFGIIIILLGVGGYFIVYFIKKRNRKKRANELDDDNFEYKQNIKNENLVDNGGEENNKDNLIIN